MIATITEKKIQRIHQALNKGRHVNYLFSPLGQWVTGTIKKIGKALAPVRKYGLRQACKQKPFLWAWLRDR